MSELCTILHTVLFLPCVILTLSHVHTILSLSNSPDNDCGFFFKNLHCLKFTHWQWVWKGWNPPPPPERIFPYIQLQYLFVYGSRVCLSVFTSVSFLVFVELHSMSMRLVSSGGTYNVRASEMSSHLQDRQPKMVTCIVHFLDDSQTDFEVDVSVLLTPSFPVLPPFFFFVISNNIYQIDSVMVI